MDNVAARRLLVSCFEAGLAAVDPEAAVTRNLESIPGRVAILALGKAAPAMAWGAHRALGRPTVEGLVVSNHSAEVPPGLELMIGSHPVPDASSLAAGLALLELAETLGEGDTALVLISGGGSALAEVPVPGVSIADIATANELLLRSGADIVATNTVRRRVSMLKGGGLAASLYPARVVTLAVSDVVGDIPEAIASGPTVSANDDPGAARELVADLGIEEDLPDSVRAALDAPLQRHRGSSDYRIVAGAAAAAHAAVEAAEDLGVRATVVDTRMVGDAGEAAGEVLRRAGRGLSAFAGETTVEVVGDGIGGRNHEAALVAATLLDGRQGIWFLAAGTDGIDGTTGAAGAIVDGGTVSRGRRVGLDAAAALDRNDSGAFFAGLGEQLVTGPTGTNVGDLWMVLRTA